MARSRRRRRSQESGFTLIEIMMVVAIIAILAIIAIPQFTSQSNQTRARSEVTAFFAAIAAKEEDFKVENSKYFPLVPGATAACPAMSVAGTTVTCANAGQPWAGLNVNPPTTTAYCSYTITSGTGVVANATVAGVTFVFTGGAGSWYHIFAQCDLDGNGTKVSFFTSSQKSDIQVNGIEGE